MLWPGFTGEFMKQLPITVFMVLIASLFYSLIIIPVLGSLFGQKQSALHISDNEKSSFFFKLAERYGKFAYRFVKNPLETILWVFTVLAVIVFTYTNFGKGTVYFAIVDPVQAEVNIRARGNFSALESKEIIESVEQRFLEIDQLSSVYLRAGSNWWDRGADKIGSGFIEIAPPYERSISGLEVMELVTNSTKDIPGIIVETKPVLGGPSFDSPIELAVYGNTEDIVNDAANKIEKYITENIPDLINISSSKAYPSVEWSVEVDKQKAAQLGVNIGDVGALVQMLTNGFKVGEYRPDDSKDEIEIRARFPEADRTLTGIKDLNVTTRQGLVPVSSFISVIPKENRQTVRRKNGRYHHRIRAGTEDESRVAEKVAEIQEWLDTNPFDKNLEVVFEGMSEETEEVNSFMIGAGIAAVFIMLIMLLTQFNSFYQSLIVLTSVTISIVGVMLGLLITNSPFSTTMTGLSIVTLAGIVVNNNIVLIDTFNKMKEESPHLKKSNLIVSACKQRLRPILLTSLTTIFGLLPLAMGVSVDLIGREILIGSRIVDWWSNLAISIVFGLGFSTFITLILTPAVLALPYGIRNDLKKYLKASN